MQLKTIVSATVIQVADGLDTLWPLMQGAKSPALHRARELEGEAGLGRLIVTALQGRCGLQHSAGLDHCIGEAFTSIRPYHVHQVRDWPTKIWAFGERLHA